MQIALRSCFAVRELCLFSIIVLFICCQTGSVPLGIAAELGKAEVVETLLDAGAYIDHQNKVLTYNVL